MLQVSASSQGPGGGELLVHPCTAQDLWVTGNRDPTVQLSVEGALLGALVGALLGALVGALLGALVARKHSQAQANCSLQAALAPWLNLSWEPLTFK